MKTELEIKELAEKQYPTLDRNGADIYHTNDLREHCQDAFIEGYKQAQPKWIDVDDRLPELSMTVLVYGRQTKDSEKKVFEAYMDIGRKRFTILCLKAKDVTHWMHLPEKPSPPTQ